MACGHGQLQPNQRVNGKDFCFSSSVRISIVVTPAFFSAVPALSLVTSIMSHYPFLQFNTAPRYISGGVAPFPFVCGLTYVDFRITSVTIEAASVFSGNIDMAQDAF